MATQGLIQPMPLAALFADTHAEAKYTYELLDWLAPRLSFPLIRIDSGSLPDQLTTLLRSKTGRDYIRASIPAYVPGKKGRPAALPRRCTTDFKVRPLRRAARTYRATHVWIGISTDEAHRMKPNNARYLTNRWPLIELGMSRDDCKAWLLHEGYPIPERSACIFCPYHNDESWARLKRIEPESFAAAAQIERTYQITKRRSTIPQDDPYLHRSRQPLATLTFSTETDQVNLFGNECTGLCGV